MTPTPQPHSPYAAPQTPADAARALLLDHYDSFTWNLANLLVMAGLRLDVRQYNDPGQAELDLSAYACLVLSPGPGAPQDYPQTHQLLDRWETLPHAPLPVLGVCLGSQLLAERLGAATQRCAEPVHGKVHALTLAQHPLFARLPQPLPVTRYHSLYTPAPYPSGLEPLAWTEDQLLMAFEAPSRRYVGIQFHPEAVLTQGGQQLLVNWLKLNGLAQSGQERGLDFSSIA